MKKLYKRVFAAVLCLALAATIVPATVFADDGSEVVLTGIDFVCTGYGFGKQADNVTVTSETEGVIISGVTVKCPGTPPTDDNYQEFHGTFSDNTLYKVEFFVRIADGYMLPADLPTSAFIMDVGMNGVLGGVSYYPSEDGFVFVSTLPIINYNPDLAPKSAAAFSISGYELGADIADITVTVADEEIEIIETDIRNADTGEYCTGIIQGGIQYEVVITAFTPGGWYINRETIKNITLNIGTFSGYSIVSLTDIRILAFRYKLPVFGEIIDDPDDPGDEQYEKISSLDFHLTGYELGNDSKNVSVTCDNEGAVILKVSVKTPAGEAYDGPIQAGQRYQVTVTVNSRGGWDLPYKFLSCFKIDGTPATDFGMESGSETKTFVYYVYALAASDDIDTISDMDCDGEITVSDALGALRIAAILDVAVTPKSTRSAILGDVDGDKDISVGDSLTILRKAAKLA